MSKWWMIRAGDYNELIPEWITKGVASIGWPSVGNPKEYINKQELLKKFDQVCSKEKPGTRKSWCNQVWRFSKQIRERDRVITYDQASREYYIGSVVGEYEYRPDIIKDYPNIIKVKWEEKRISRDKLSQGAKNSLGSISTFFSVDQWGDELQGLLKLNDNSIIEEIDEETEEENYKSFIQQTYSWAEDYIDKLDPWQMQDLVGGLLVAMGYKVKISEKGPDGGVDIIAHKDAFGFEKPIIKVQVKHRKSKSTSQEIQQLLGANPIGESCIFVSTGGFTTSAMKVANINRVKLIALTDLIEYIFDWYEKFPDEIKSLIPFKRVYIPVIL